MRFAIGQPSQVQKPLTRLVNSLSLIPLAYLFEQLGLAGLHSGIGPSSALSIGVAIATYVQAKPTIRINILTARFMVCSPYAARLLGGNLAVAALYRGAAVRPVFSPADPWEQPANSLFETLDLTLAQRVEAQRDRFSTSAFALRLASDRASYSSIR
jgi:hypothetical protein